MKISNLLGKAITKKLKNKVNKTPQAHKQEQSNQNYDNNSLELVTKGFADRRNDVNDNNIFERIIESYNKAKVKHSDSGNVYQIGNEWISIYKNYMNEIILALTTCSIDKVKSIYNNFFRESCSVGLHGLPVDMFKHFFNGKINDSDKVMFLNDFLHRLDLWKITIGQSYGINSLESPNIGNPYGYFDNGIFIRTGSDYLHYYATIIGRLIKGDNHKTILELGGGFGGMAYYLCRDNTDITYLDFDLPENLALTSFYMLSAFPEKKIALYGEIDLKSASINDYDIVLMPNFEIFRIKDDTVELVFNSYSLAEMSRESVENYIDIINRVAKKFIFHINHTRSSVINSDEFKFDLNKFELLYRAPALWNKARNKEMDEFEYLYINKQLNFDFNKNVRNR